MRDGIYGSALVRLSTDTIQDVLAKGDVGGFMVWSNRRYSSYDQGLQMSFCETADKLIVEAWEVAQLNATRRKSRY